MTRVKGNINGQFLSTTIFYKDRLGTEALKMVQIAGKYGFSSQENFHNFLEAAGEELLVKT